MFWWLRKRLERKRPTGFRGSTGIVVGLFAPELLLALVDGKAGSALSSLIWVHDEGRMGVDLDDYFPPESAVVVLVAARRDIHRVDGALLRARTVACRAVDDEHYRALSEVLIAAGDEAAIWAGRGCSGRAWGDCNCQDMTETIEGAFGNE